jgi:cell division protein FtsQ
LATSISRRAESGLAPAIPRPTLRTAALGLVALALVGAVAFLVSRSAIMHVRRIEVSGIERLSASKVIHESGIDESTNALWFAPAAAEAALEQDPWISSVSVKRILPWTIQIHVVERSPVASMVTASGYQLIASDGTVLGMSARDPGLPNIIGAAAVEGGSSPPGPRGAALVVGSLDADLRSMVEDVGVDAGGAVQIRLRGGVAVDLGEPVNLAAKAEALAATLAWAEEQHLRLRAIDVSAPRVPTVDLAA